MPGFASSISNSNEVVFAKNADFTLSADPSSQNGLITNGQLWIGHTDANLDNQHVFVGTLTSPGGTVAIGYSSPNITLDIAGGSAAVEHLTGNTGGQLNPTANNFNIVTANSTPVFAGVVSTLTVDFNLTNLVLGSSLPSLAGAVFNVGVGAGVMSALTSSSGNVGIGFHSLLSLAGGSGGNTAVGENSLIACTTGAGNTAIGLQAGGALTNATNNTIVGTNAFNGSNGSSNVVIGNSAGGSFNGTESSNIVIGNTGTVGDNNIIRIGTQGAGGGQQNECFVAGIVGVTASNAQLVTINSSTGQLGVTTLNPSGFPWVDATSATQALVVNTGYVTNHSATVVYTLPATAALGDTIKIVGKLGLATITPNANQQILIGSGSGSVGVTGTAVSQNVGDCIELICITAGASTVWRAANVQGTWVLT